MSRTGLSPGEVGALLPLEWAPAQAPDSATLVAEGQSAARRLGLLLTFEEVFAKGYPGSSDLSGELAPLAARVDWLLDWVLANHPPEPGSVPPPPIRGPDAHRRQLARVAAITPSAVGRTAFLP